MRSSFTSKKCVESAYTLHFVTGLEMKWHHAKCLSHQIYICPNDKMRIHVAHSGRSF